MGEVLYVYLHTAFILLAVFVVFKLLEWIRNKSIQKEVNKNGQRSSDKIRPKALD